MHILYEDNHLLAVNKPAGLATQSSEHNSNSLEEEAKAYIKEAKQKPQGVYLHAIHRLDKPTSGVVLFAKTSKSLSRLQEMMRKHEMKKIYLALVEGTLKNPKGTLRHNLIHDEHKAIVSSAGKPCELHYETVATIDGNTLVAIELITGRYHQIRAQFQAIHHPVLGDKKYGCHKPFHSDTIALHHHSLTFTHPVTHALLEIKAPLPSYWPKVTW